MSRYKELFRDTAIFAIGSIGTKLILFLMVPLYTNYMSSAEYGTADLIFTIAQLMTSFLSIVIFDAVIRFGISSREKRENVLFVGFVVLFFSAISGAIITPVIGLYKTITEWKWYLYIYVLASILYSIEFNYLKVLGRNRQYAALNIFQTGLMACLNVYFLVIKSLGVRGYLLAYIISTLVVDFIAFVKEKLWQDLLRAKFDGVLFRNMVLYSAPLILNNVSWWVIHSSDKIMVEIMVSTAALGVYTAAAKIPALINVVVSVFQQAWGISAIKEIESENENAYYSDVLKYLFLFTSGICIFFVSIIKIFMHYYIGSAFSDAWHYVPLLLVSAVFSAVASYYGSMYGALKKSINNMLTTLLAAAINIAINWLLIPTTGIWGAVIGTVVAYIVVAFARMADVNRYLEITVNWKTFIATCGIIIGQAIAVSLDFHIGLCSVIAAVAFVLFNRDDLSFLFKKFITLMRAKHKEAS